MRGSELLPSPPEDELPHLWQKPAYEALFGCLQKIRVEPRVWNLQISRADILKEQAAAAYDPREIISFLSAIIKSRLAWLDSDDEREVLWEEASKRMSERCGRTGRFPEFGNRTWARETWASADYCDSHGRDHSAMAL